MKKTSLISLLSDDKVLEDLRSAGLEGITKDEGQLDRLLEGKSEAVTPGEYTDEEAIILLTGRPSQLIQDGVWAQPSSAEIRKRLDGARTGLEAAIPRVGRVEILDSSSDYIGTGWMIDEDVMVTNRHVAELFAVRRPGKPVFRSDPGGGLLRVRVDYLREHQRSTVRQVAVEEVLFIEEPGEGRPDMALLRLAKGAAGLPAPLELDPGVVAFHDHVAVIGYPAEDPRNDAFAMRAYFNTVFGVKRLSPGWIVGVRADGMLLQHDCTTLGGNSGSPVINLATGKACGLHFSGTYRESNYAVTSAAIRQRLAQIGRPLVAVPAGNEMAANREAPAGAPNIAAVEGLGYDPDFLGADELSVPLPELNDEQVAGLAPVKDRDDGELQYSHFSIKMCAERRVAYFTAVNIDGERMFGFPRAKDRWFADPRLEDEAHQTDESLYSRNNLDRGHLVRRLDPGWGDTRSEGAQAIDHTFFFTNCSPQHSLLNQKTWLSLEDYVLKNAATHALRVTVFTGPVFRADDRSYRGVQLPEEFWKVVVIVNEFTGRLSATGYIVSQADYLGDLEFVFGEFRTFQVPVSTIEEKTGIRFGALADNDPLAFIESRPQRVVAGPDDLVL